ncbi:hypothetical protein ACFYT4_26220 [Streptomyces sp. NPDC004609]|uniref:hypothetical protein n=1 Tax=Streptomyces sp. NPDC004609 TaxID=3364704 RepID=UPI0036B0F460
MATLRGTTTLAGTTLFMADAFRRAVSTTGIPLPDAVQMTSRTAARLIGLNDRGARQPGLRADMVELDAGLRPTRVWLGGTTVT